MDADVFKILEVLVIGFFIGFLIAFIIFSITIPNGESDIGLSQEAGDLICQKITNNTNAIAQDWNHESDDPRDSLICIIKQERIDGGLIQIIGN